MPPEADVHVELAGALPGFAGPAGLRLPSGARLADALTALGMSDAVPVGIWGRRAAPDTPLREGDRIEVYRPLKADPKTVRRTRASGASS